MSLLPELPPAVLRAFGAVYGILLLLTLAAAAPHWRRFFLSERWGGYSRSSPAVDWIQNPWVMPIVGGLWAGCAFGLVAGRLRLPAAALNVLFGYYFFVFMRWRGLLRGLGAPGYMTYWLGLALFLLELSARFGPGVSALALWAAQIDLALIVFSAGFYKSKSGYCRNEGMNYGLVNPMWSYWPRTYRRLPADGWFFRGLNQLAWSSQILGAALMLVPPTRFLGGLLLIGTYLYIGTQIRLGFLAEMMCAAGLLFWVDGSPGAALLQHHLGAAAAPVWAGPRASALGEGLALALGLYLLLLPLCHAGLFCNFYARRALPGRWQKALDAYANFFGLILWRVFSADHLNFHIEIYFAPAAGGGRPLLSRWRDPASLRFWHVGEAIAVTSLFTTIKYYGEDHPLFRERLFRYARTLDCPVGHEVVFDYIDIRRRGDRYQDAPSRRYRLDLGRDSLVREWLDPDSRLSESGGSSIVFKAAHPGTYSRRTS